MKIKKIKKKRGMTMIELLMVLVIIGSILALLISSLTKSKDRASGKLNKLKMQMDWAKISTALMDYQRMYGNYPDSGQGLAALVHPPKADDSGATSSFLDEESIMDQWKRPYHYEVTDNGFKVLSLGADGAIGGEGDNADIDLATLK